MKTLDEIKRKALDGELKEALEFLLGWCQTHRIDAIREVEHSIGLLNSRIKEKHNLTITAEELRIAKANIQSKCSEWFHLTNVYRKTLAKRFGD